jgi:hypothetical protein
MGTPFRTTRHDPVAQAIWGLAQGVTFSPDVDDVRPLGLMTFGFVVSDTYIGITTPVTNYSVCPGVTTSFSACPTVSTTWNLA